MGSVETNKDFLRFLISSSKKSRSKLISAASKKEINSICEIILNILKGNIPLSDDLKSSLSRRKKKLRQLVKRVKLSTKKKILQTGGFLQFLIPAIITGLSTFASSLIKKE